MRLRHLLLTLAALVCLAAPAQAQVANLAADSVTITPNQTIIAEGNVEIFFGETILRAARVEYSANGDQLKISGPIYITDGSGAVMVAESAELDETLQRGIIRGARLVLDQQLQLAAVQIDQVGGRYTQLSRVAASSCQVCAARPTPVWEIRARRVIRDQQELQLYFEDAQLRLLGLPIFYTPMLRLPDPSLKRAQGFLVPDIETSSRLGTGIKLPYFIPLGDHADLTFAPYLSTSTATLEGIYRQELSFGSLSARGAISRDDLDPDSLRAYLFAEGFFDLPRDFKLEFDAELVSDNAYLLQYQYSEKDRLDSGIRLERTRDKDDLALEVTSFRTLRASEFATTNELPNELVELRYDRRLLQDPGLGDIWLQAGFMSLQRPSSTPTVGRDVTRFGVSLDWDKRWVLPMGLVANGQAGVALDQYFVGQDPGFDDRPNRRAETAALSLRWPLQRSDAGGVRHLLEPLAVLAWADTQGDAVPNEDSTVVEFDEGNLGAVSRFPGLDRYETGLRANLGLGWTRLDPNGWSVGTSVGRIVRFEDKSQFAQQSGLSGTASDWMVGVGLSLGERIQIESRSVFDDGATFSLSETRVGWNGEYSRLVGTYLWKDEVTADDISELTLDAAYDITPNWTASVDWRYEADASRTTAAGLGVSYQNECIGVDLSVSRRFTSSTSVDPITDVALRVFLTGFGTGNGAGNRAQNCGG